MALGLNEATSDRTVAEITWTEGDFEGQVNFRATNPDSHATDRDASTKTVDASALAVVYTFPEGYSGDSVITGTDEAGNQHAIKLSVENGEVVGKQAVGDD